MSGYGISDLPEELLLKVFSHLADIGPAYEDAEDPWFVKRLPFRNQERDDQPHPGLRAYPFLGQVCRKWKDLLATPLAQSLMWKQLVVDFGHELVTAIHTPLVWSNQRPSAEDFSLALSRTNLSTSKILDFMIHKQKLIQSLILCNSEGFWGDEGEYISLNNKHNFQASHLGCMMGMLRERLQELKLFNCNDLINTDLGLWTLVGLCPQLRIISVEGINCRIPSNAAGELARLPKLESLSLVGEEHSGQWIVGLDSLPPSWSALTALTCLELRGHQLLDTLPSWMTSLTALRKLDVSDNANMNLASVTTLTQLETLAMQRLDFSQAPVGSEAISAAAKRVLPDLAPLAPRLRALSLSGNRFTRLPACLLKLTGLEVLDLANNKELVVASPLTPLLAALPNIAIIDLRGVHKEKGAYWSDAKCSTMKHIAAFAKLLKRRRYRHRVLMDVP